MALGNKQVMAENIEYYMKKHDKTRNDVCDALGIKYTTFTDWVKGNTYPRIDKIEMLARYFHITKADLVEERADVEDEDMERIGELIGINPKRAREVLEVFIPMQDEVYQAFMQIAKKGDD